MTIGSDFSEVNTIKVISSKDGFFFLCSFLFLYTQLFQLPFTPYYFDGDQMISVSNAMRLVGGEIIYKDFFHLTPPGAEVVYAALFYVFGVKVWVLNFVVLALGFCIASLTWYLSRQVVSGLYVYLAPTLLLVVGFRPFFIDGSYRLFSIVCVLAAAAALIKRRDTTALTIAGGFCGLASFFVQPRGVLALGGVTLFLLWESFQTRFELGDLVKRGLIVVGSFFLVLVLTNAYFIWQAGFDNYYFALVTFLQTHYKHDPLSNSDAFFTDITQMSNYFEIFPPFTAASRIFRIAAPLLFFYLVSLVYLVFLLVRFRRKDLFGSSNLEARLMLLFFIGLPLIVGMSAPSGFRFAHVSMPAIVLLVWLLQQLSFSRVLGTVLLGVLGLIGVAYIIQRQTVEKYYLDLPAGRSAFLPKAAYEKYKWIGEQVTAGEVFYEPYHPGFYFPFHLVNPTPMYLIRDSDYSPKFQIDSVMAGLEKNPPRLIVWPSKWSKKPEERVEDDYLAPLWHYLSTNYERVRVFPRPADDTLYSVGDVEVWRRKS